MNWLTRLNRGQTRIDFVKWWPRGLVLSLLLLLVSVGSLATRGLDLGIDFEGGVSYEVAAPGVSVSEARDALEPVGEGQAKIQIVGTDTLRVQGPESTPEHTAEVRRVLGELAGTGAAEVSVSSVGASWGGDITRAAIRALVFFFIAILLYLSFRLELRMAVAAVIAVLHDVIISVGVYSIFQFEVTPGTVIAFLTILGYSIYDTIVVDDKIKENENLVGLSGGMTYAQMTSVSMNQVLLRSLNTTITSLIPVISMLVVGAGIMGAVTLQEFAIALTVGIGVGAYSSIYVSAPVLVFLKERQPKYRSIRERLGTQGSPGASGATTATRGDDTAAPADPTGASGAARPASGVIPPRPRKKNRKR